MDPNGNLQLSISRALTQQLEWSEIPNAPTSRLKTLKEKPVACRIKEWWDEIWKLKGRLVG